MHTEVQSQSCSGEGRRGGALRVRVTGGAWAIAAWKVRTPAREGRVSRSRKKFTLARTRRDERPPHQWASGRPAPHKP